MKQVPDSSHQTSSFGVSQHIVTLIFTQSAFLRIVRIIFQEHSDSDSVCIFYLCSCTCTSDVMMMRVCVAAVQESQECQHSSLFINSLHCIAFVSLSFVYFLVYYMNYVAYYEGICLFSSPSCTKEHLCLYFPSFLHIMKLHWES